MVRNMRIRIKTCELKTLKRLNLPRKSEVDAMGLDYMAKLSFLPLKERYDFFNNTCLLYRFYNVDGLDNLSKRRKQIGG